MRSEAEIRELREQAQERYVELLQKHGLTDHVSITCSKLAFSQGWDDCQQQLTPEAEMPYSTEEMLDDFRKDVAARDATIAQQAEAIRLLRAACQRVSDLLSARRQFDGAAILCDALAATAPKEPSE